MREIISLLKKLNRLKRAYLSFKRKEPGSMRELKVALDDLFDTSK